jgi:energy-coupling factor transporter ATP-binding protein EcfA2
VQEDNGLFQKGAPLDYIITIRNCNSIDEASITLRRGALNIKYGRNGLGKSTIAKALQYRAEGVAKLESLTPFRYRDAKDGLRPSVTGADEIAHVMTFDDSYVSNFVFTRDEVLENSFEVFIKTEEFRVGNEEIESIFDSLKQTFRDEVEFTEAVKNFTLLKDAFNITSAGSVAKTSKGFKALSVGGKIDQVPEHLSGFTNFIQSDDPANWVSWQTKGQVFLELSDNCPFCSGESIDKDTAKKVSQEYDSAAVRNMSELRGLIDRLGDYFDPPTLQSLKEVTGSISGLSPEQEHFLVSLRGQIETFLGKLSRIESLSFPALRDEKDLLTALRGLKIQLHLLPALGSEKTTSVTTIINTKLDSVAVQIGLVKGRINTHKSHIAKQIASNQEEVNAFLRSAGYRYEVKIVPSEDTYRMLLNHMDAPGDHVQNAGVHLSYGEKNAFAMVLFMHDVQYKKPDLVVLDDPVSSFDQTKKFAIINQLFRGRNTLRDTTTLLLTHDIEPAIDMIRVGTKNLFAKAEPVVHFLYSERGTVIEKAIESQHLMTFTQVCEVNIKASPDPVIKSIYLRRLHELYGKDSHAWDLLSNLLKARENPVIQLKSGETRPFSQAEFDKATTEIKDSIPDFDYNALVMELREKGSLKNRFAATKIGYEKVQLFRIMTSVNEILKQNDKVFTKFLNTAFHIESEYVLQLNPREFEAVPEYIVDRCTELIASIR